MMDVLKTISETSVPNILMGLGAMLILLALVEKIGTHIELPANRQRIAAIVGAAFLIAGVGVTVAPHLPAANPERGIVQLTGIEAPEEKETSTSEPSRTVQATAAVGAAGAKIADEPTYSGVLGSLMPDPALLPDNVRQFSSRNISPRNALEETSKADIGRVRELLFDGGYSGIEEKYDLGCWSLPPGEVRHWIFQVHRFGAPEVAKAWWDLDNGGTDPKLRSRSEWSEQHDSWLGQFITDCGNKTALMVWRMMRVGNVILVAATFSAPGDLGDARVLDKSRELIESMALKVMDS